MKLVKYENNPILTKNESNDWESLVVLNPAVYYEEKDDTFYMLYRAAGNDYTHHIHLGLATSKDGINFERQSNKPILSPDINGADGGGVEDPRLTKMGDWYYLTYASRPYAPGRYWEAGWKPLGEDPEFGPKFLKKNSTVSYLALSKDMKNWKKVGRITDARYDDRDVILFPELINGKYVKLSRAMEWFGEGYPNENPAMWISYSDDLMEWSDYRLLIKGETDWESKKIGGSTPPLKTKDGWLIIYHGVSKADDRYRVGAILTDLNNPEKIIARTQDYIMEPEFEHETQGFYTGCVFPTGNVIKDGKLYVYYGAADKCICVATANIDEFLKHLLTNCKV